MSATPTTQTATYVPAVTVYGDFSSRDLSISEAVTFHERNDRTVTLMLGAMRPGYLGREVVTLADLDRWLADEEQAEQWATVEDGERFAAENGATS